MQPHNLTRLLTAAVLAAAGVLLSSSPADAGCNYHPANISRIGVKVALSDAELPPLPVQPCHGPNCSSCPQPRELPFSAPPVAPSRSHDLTALPSSADDLAVPSAGEWASFEAGSPVRRVSSLLRPPRHG